VIYVPKWPLAQVFIARVAMKYVARSMRLGLLWQEGACQQ
jgi:hypothetical protein